MLAPGESVGAYEIVAKLREGGMATLFVAKRRGAAGFEKPVAIKVVHPHLAADATLRAMLVDEARIAVQVRHPNVVQIEDLGEHDGQPFIAMEYVHGVSLGQLLQALGDAGRRMTPTLATRIAMDVAGALHAAHEARGADGRALDVVHRDVSPQNILLSHDGHVKVIDFGVAKARGRAVETSAGALKGKFAYMAPEQAKGRDLDRRTDVYALGIVLWEMLTNRRLFHAKEEVQVLLNVRDPDVTPPRELAPAVGEALDAVVMAALSPDPQGRPATAGELRKRLVLADPEAAALDPGTIAALLLAVGNEAMVETLDTLPAEVSAMIGHDRAAGEEGRMSLAVDALTVLGK